MTALLHPLHRALAVLLAALALLVVAAPAFADDAADRKALDTLFAQLRVAPDAEAAHRIDQQIWQIWTNPSDEILRLRMLDVIEARTYRGLNQTLQLLDALVTDFPDYAEGWNQRATVHFMLGQYEESLADIDRTLALEPRHFGALAGRVMIHLDQGKRPLALKEMVNALAIHPFLAEKQLFPELRQDMTRT